MKKALEILASVVKWTVVVLLCVEVAAFITITGMNYVIYGIPREGARVRYDPYAMFLNQQGVRPTWNNSSSADPDKNRVLWLLGGSTMRGSTPDDDKTIPSFLAKELNSGGEPLHFTVFNFGEHSFNSLLETKYLQKLLTERPDRPDLIIFYDGANDSKYLAEHRTPYGHHGYRRFSGIIESYWGSVFGILKPLNAAVYTSFTKELYDRCMQALAPLDAKSELVGSFVDLTEKRYEYVNTVAHAFGAKFLLFWQPCLWVETAPVEETVRSQEKKYVFDAGRFPGLKQNFAVPSEALAKRLHGKDYFVDFSNTLCDRADPVYQADGVHLNDRGREKVAKNMARVLREKMGSGWPRKSRID